MTVHAQYLKQKDFVHELPKMDFQDHFVVIFHLSYSEEKMNRFQVSEKRRKLSLRFVDNCT